MSAGVVTAGRLGPEPGGRRISLSPAEGWITLISAALMVVVFAISLIDAAWVGNAGGSQGFLLWAGLLGFAIGVIGAKIGWGRWRTHIVGALFGGLLIPLVMGGLAQGDQLGWAPVDLAQRLVAAYDVVANVWSDLVVRGLSYTNQIAHYHLVFGVLVYGAGLLAGFTVFGHRRPLDAVVVVGLATLANMAVTEHDQLYLLVVFSAAALFLLIRTHVFEEEVTWARRKIGDPSVVGELLVRGGTAFVTIAIVGSILLTFTAASAPLQGLWSELPRQLQDLALLIQKLAPTGGEPKPIGVVGFSSSQVTGGEWNPSTLTAFRAQFDPAETGLLRWRAGTYAVYKDKLDGWAWDEAGLPVRREPIAPNDPYQVTTFRDAVTSSGHREIRIGITPDAFRDATILSPSSIELVDRATDAIVVGNDGWFTSIESREGSGPYTVTALVPVYGNGPDDINEARLRTAGTNYPAELERIYTALPDGAVGPVASQLLQDIRAAVRTPPGYPANNAYDLARTMETYLRSDRFAYEDNVKELVRQQCLAGISTVECFAIIRQGYCEYYASTMAVLMREAGVPARIAYGFLPSEPGPDGVEVVGGAAMHWWVEVYFPGLGWIEFDPTGGDRGQVTAIPSGSLSPATPRPSVNAGTIPPQRSFNTGGGPTNTPPPSNIIPFIAIGFILVIGVVALATAAIRRTPNKPMHPDQAWGSMARLAARFGLGPRPSQTVYEYAGALGDAVPTARVELTTIARAKVEVAYGNRDLGGDRLKRVAEAYHRLRLAIIGVVLRRVLRRPRRGR
jgi:transglutaminase-like putative cysteine protease